MTLYTVVLSLGFALLTPIALGAGLSTCLSKYPDYDGDIDISDGSAVTVRFAKLDSNEMVFKFLVKNAEADCVNCGVHIHSGTTCDNHDDVGGHYWNDDIVEDPWTTDNGAVYNTNYEGMTHATNILNSGHHLKENLGHAVVVHAQDGTRIGCGVLSNGGKAAKNCKPTKTVLHACIAKYPDYNGDLAGIIGKVKVRFLHESMKFKYKLKGADPNCKECGIHIHSGTTCDDANLVGAHYWDDNNNAIDDPWNAKKGAFYTTDTSGVGASKFFLSSGLDAEENVGHAVVVHDAEGIRYGCGVLSSETAACFA